MPIQTANLIFFSVVGTKGIPSAKIIAKTTQPNDNIYFPLSKSVSREFRNLDLTVIDRLLCL
jgi:hypothetical protein